MAGYVTHNFIFCLCALILSRFGAGNRLANEFQFEDANTTNASRRRGPQATNRSAVKIPLMLKGKTQSPIVISLQQGPQEKRRKYYRSRKADKGNTKRPALATYLQTDLKNLKRWWAAANPLGNGPLIMKMSFWIIVVAEVLGPFVLYCAVSSVLFRSSAKFRESYAFADQLVSAILYSLKLTSWLMCLTFGLMVITCGEDPAKFPLLKSVERFLRIAIVCSIAMIPVKGLTLVDKALFSICSETVERGSFTLPQEMLDGSRGEASVGRARAGIDGHGCILYTWLWRPIYYVSLFFVFMTIVLACLDYPVIAFCLSMVFLVIMMLATIFGASTLGAEVFGSLVIHLDKPFVEGDLITFGGKGCASSEEGSGVTGFVEHIGLRSVRVRSFDMTETTVPNSYFFKELIGNWSTRPRKLIKLDCALSHRTPLEVCRIFHEKVDFLVRNHPGVDADQYIKVGFRALEKGIEFVVICLNSHGYKKSEVQQDLCLKVADIAQKLGVRLVFNQQTHDIEFQKALSADRHQISEEAVNKINDLLPKKRDQQIEGLYSRDGHIVVRVDKVSTIEKFIYSPPSTFSSISTPSVVTSLSTPVEEHWRKRTFQIWTPRTKEEDLVKKRTFQIGLCLTQADTPEVDDERAVFSHECVAGADDTELRFDQSVMIPLEDYSDEVSQMALNQDVELTLLDVSMTYQDVIRRTSQVIGRATFQVGALALKTLSQSEPVVVQLRNHKGDVASIHLQVYVPEAANAILKSTAGE